MAQVVPPDQNFLTGFKIHHPYLLYLDTSIKNWTATHIGLNSQTYSLFYYEQIMKANYRGVCTMLPTIQGTMKVLLQLSIRIM